MNEPLQHLQKRTEELQRQQAQADALFASIGDGAIATDAQGKVNRINQVALDLLGFTQEDLMGKWLTKSIIAQDEYGQAIKSINRPVMRAFLSGKAVIQKTWYRRKDGSILPVAVTVSPILLGGKPIGAIEVFRDIAFEQEVDRMKTEFIYLASHQLRTPLTAIKTYAHMLNEGYRGQLAPGQSEFMQIILSSLDRMNEIISTLLNISRIEAGKIAVTAVPVRLDRLLDQALRELTPSISTKHVTITTNLKAADPVSTDQILVKEVCLNLLSNALKYTPESGTVTVTLTQKKDSQLIAIKDTGYGIPKESQEHVFGKFYRAPNILDKAESGTGLGLYLVRGISDILGAKVWFSSVEGKGSTFYFSLPMGAPKKPDKN